MRWWSFLRMWECGSSRPTAAGGARSLRYDVIADTKAGFVSGICSCAVVVGRACAQTTSPGWVTSSPAGSDTSRRPRTPHLLPLGLLLRLSRPHRQHSDDLLNNLTLPLCPLHSFPHDTLFSHRARLTRPDPPDILLHPAKRSSAGSSGKGSGQCL